MNLSSRQVRHLMKRFISPEYLGFGYTFVSEKLKELENLNIKRETLRQWMIEQEFIKAASVALSLVNLFRLTTLIRRM